VRVLVAIYTQPLVTVANPSQILQEHLPITIVLERTFRTLDTIFGILHYTTKVVYTFDIQNK